MANHKDVVNAETHEPKHITDTLTTDAGKVLTPSDSVSGTSELRKLVAGEVEGLMTTFGAMSVMNNSNTQALTTATDTNLRTFSDYVLIENFTEAAGFTAEGVTFSSNEMTVDASGTYIIDGFASFGSSTGSTLFGFQPAINGTVPSNIISKFLVTNSNTPTVISGTGIVELAASDTVGLYVACDGNINLTVEDAYIRVTRIK